MHLTEMFYAVVGWLNFPDKSTPLGKKNLRHMDSGILQCAQHILALSQDKLDSAEAAKFIVDWSLNTDTWIATVTHKDGTKESYDFPIEMLPTRIDLDDDDNLVLVQQDGTTKKISFERFVYTTKNTATIAMELNGTEISANVIDGSITLDKLEPTIMATLRQYMLDAQTAAVSAEQYYTAARSWAVGGTESRDGEDTDNSKWYSEQSKASADLAAQYSKITAPGFYFDQETSKLYMKAGVGVEFIVIDSRLYWKVS